jgi:hypothetical protein
LNFVQSKKCYDKFTVFNAQNLSQAMTKTQISQGEVIQLQTNTNLSLAQTQARAKVILEEEHKKLITRKREGWGCHEKLGRYLWFAKSLEISNSA